MPEEMMVPKIPDKFLTPKETAIILGITRNSVYRWFKCGWLTGRRLPNGGIRISKECVGQMTSDE